MSGVKKERWTEAEVLALPAGEHEYFDRKSGALLASADFRKDTAKALSAFANSGGGHLVIGVRDDNTIDGVQAARGRAPTREWLEQLVPNLLDYRLEDFRVHEVEPATPSAIPGGRVVLVVDVGDSALAPHQAQPQRTYYYREGGHSKPAPHFYIETLRNRLAKPSLVVDLVSIQKSDTYPWSGGVFVEARLVFTIKNTGRLAAYKWALVVEAFSGAPPGREPDYKFQFEEFPRGQRSRSSGIRVDDTILPGLSLKEERDFGFLLRAPETDRSELLADLRALITENFHIECRIATETSPGEPVTIALAPLIDYETFI